MMYQAMPSNNAHKVFKSDKYLIIKPLIKVYDMGLIGEQEYIARRTKLVDEISGVKFKYPLFEIPRYALLHYIQSLYMDCNVTNLEDRLCH
jgi:hypothetical protein